MVPPRPTQRRYRNLLKSITRKESKFMKLTRKKHEAKIAMITTKLQLMEEFPGRNPEYIHTNLRETSRQRTLENMRGRINPSAEVALTFYRNAMGQIPEDMSR
jgi:peptide subunit release factor 1 (eRF1)